ncbi:glycerate kinase [Muriicola jejuensis]|uniref:Glycerate kinase n=1 Tax=Muriicola jejuensis TaxID=504488 RepID=A0A6P0U7E3_9FLAO|nr:glycerate kinase [Muriicola jejuensis]NER09057.1 glycerate kinase [Muriicola jejuensis]SMP11522.1 glycerate kinase [Muriicola jejuensis]
MRFVLIPDKFKGSLSAKEVIGAMSSGIRQVHPEAEISSVIASDGGDGFLHAVASAIPVREVLCQAVDPLGRKIESRYLFSREDQAAYIEMAECSGLVLLDASERNPTRTTTLGTGMQIRDALERGARKIYIGLGGSATNDGGIGIAHGLGFRFRDRSGKVLEPVGGNLTRVHQIDTRAVMVELKGADLFAINDVQNPLLGSKGAAAVYAPQKGADVEEIRSLEEGLKNLDLIVGKALGHSAADLPGAGAAGGAAYGLHVFLHAKFIKGVEFMLKLTRSETLFKEGGIDLLITGEGAIDEQTLQGKLIHGVVLLGNKYRVPVLAICGKLDLAPGDIGKFGLEAILEIRDPRKPVQYSMENAAILIENSLSEYLRKRKNT